MTTMKQHINLHDRVKAKDSIVYLKVLEVLPEDKYVVTMDLIKDDVEYIVDRKEIEFVRGANDKLIGTPEIAVISVELREDLDNDFDGRMELCALVAETEFSSYGSKLHFLDEGTDTVIIYVTL